ncbi:MAG: hypothetical protein ACYC7E_00715 [Armatimonadota bacterium]
MIKASVESISGDQARVLVGDERVAIILPLQELPPGTRAGTTFRLRFSIEGAASQTPSAKATDGILSEDSAYFPYNTVK